MQVLRQLPILNSRNLLVGTATGDDAGVYRIDRNRALVQTTDFSRRSSTTRLPTDRSQRQMLCPTFMPWAAVR